MSKKKKTQSNIWRLNLIRFFFVFLFFNGIKYYFAFETQFLMEINEFTRFPQVYFESLFMRRCSFLNPTHTHTRQYHHVKKVKRCIKCKRYLFRRINRKYHERLFACVCINIFFFSIHFFSSHPSQYKYIRYLFFITTKHNGVGTQNVSSWMYSPHTYHVYFLFIIIHSMLLFSFSFLSLFLSLIT